MREIYINWFKVLVINLLVLITHSTAASYRKSNDARKNLFPLSLIHINDFHARFEETNAFSLECKRELNETCIGGYARLVSIVKRLKKTRTNPIYLNAGDNFAGTIWYSVGKWNVTQYFLNMLKADVMTIGNHEFDHGPEELVLFLNAIQSPTVLANVDLSDEPQLQGKFLNSTILVRDGRKIGIIGLVKKDINTISDTRNIRFLDEIETVRSESAKLEKAGVNIILVLSHCGIDVDLEIAQATGLKIDAVIGAHTHTFMYTGIPPGPDKPEYDYPTVIEHSNGHKVLVVQASSFAKYVGDLTIYFNEAGEAIQWEGQPIFLASNIQPDAKVLSLLDPWKRQFDSIARKVIGSTDITLDQTNCKFAECIMGDVIADAYLSSYRKTTNDTQMAIAFIQGGGVRATLPKGIITHGDILTVLPFSNRVDSFDLLGQYIWDAMEHSVSHINQAHTVTDHLLHVSGMRMVINATQPVGKRVMSIEIFCEIQYKPIDVDRIYRVVTVDFLAKGGTGYKMFNLHKQNYKFGEIDNEALINYFKSIQTLREVDTDRIIVLN